MFPSLKIHMTMYQFYFVILSIFCDKLYAYITRNLENICNLNYIEEKVFIPAWGGLILKLGHNPSYAYTLTSTWVKIEQCTVVIEAEEGFGLALVVEDMNIFGMKDITRNKLQCRDYFKVSTGSEYKRRFNPYLPHDVFKESLYDELIKESKQICGKTHNARDNIKNIKLKDMDSRLGSGNVFNTKNSKIKLFYSQNQDPYKYVNNSFTMIITTYKSASYSSCPGGQFLCSTVVKNYEYCINKAFECDNHINCAHPDSGIRQDENPQKCKTEIKVKSKPSSSTKVILIILACLSPVAFMCFFRIFFKSKHQIPTESPMNNSNRPSPTWRQQSLPMYEAVVAIHSEHSDNIDTEPSAPADPNDNIGKEPSAPGDPYMDPPSYDQLYPDGHPKENEGLKESSAVGTTADNLTPTAETVEENPKPHVI